MQRSICLGATALLVFACAASEAVAQSSRHPAAQRDLEQRSASTARQREARSATARALEVELAQHVEDGPALLERADLAALQPTPDPAMQDEPAANGDAAAQEYLPAPDHGAYYDDPYFYDGTCDATCCDGPACHVACPGPFFAGGDFLLVRPHMSDATAFIRNEASENGNNFAFRETSVDFDYDYEPNFRAFGGVRWDACQSELRVTYWNMDFSHDAPLQAAVPPIQSGATIPAVTYNDNLQNAADDPGDQIFATNSLQVNLYDVDFARRVTFTPVSCGNWCDPCCRPCPGWDMQFLLGVRVADIDREYNSAVINAQGGLAGSGVVTADFIGAGPRVGISGRRFVGPGGCWYVYGTGAASLLVGHIERNMERFTDDGQITSLTSTQADLTRTVPVGEIELGVGYRPSPWLTITGGWFFQAFGDLGASEGGAAAFIASDDTNILSFDGLTVRGEIRF